MLANIFEKPYSQKTPEEKRTFNAIGIGLIIAMFAIVIFGYIHGRNASAENKAQALAAMDVCLKTGLSPSDCWAELVAEDFGDPLAQQMNECKAKGHSSADCMAMIKFELPY